MCCQLCNDCRHTHTHTCLQNLPFGAPGMVWYPWDDTVDGNVLIHDAAGQQTEATRILGLPTQAHH